MADAYQYDMHRLFYRRYFWSGVRFGTGGKNVSFFSAGIYAILTHSYGMRRPAGKNAGAQDGKGVRTAMKRILLKLSGEALAGEKHFGFDEETVRGVARQVKQVTDAGVKVGVVIGGGNFWRGRQSDAIERTKADQIGMLATVMNCIYVSEMFRTEGMRTEVLTPFECGDFAKLYSKDATMEALEAGKVVFFAGGTGHPYFSTDTATVLRAVEMEAEAVFMAKSIDGVYDRDPAVYPDAVKYDVLPMQQVIDEKLGVIDLASAVLCLENHMPLYLFGLSGEDSIIENITGAFRGTKVTV